MRKAAAVEPFIMQGDISILEEDYVEDTYAIGGEGYEHGDDVVSQA